MSTVGVARRLRRHNIRSRPWDSSYLEIRECPNGQWVYDPDHVITEEMLREASAQGSEDGGKKSG